MYEQFHILYCVDCCELIFGVHAAQNRFVKICLTF